MSDSLNPGIEKPEIPAITHIEEREAFQSVEEQKDSFLEDVVEEKPDIVKAIEEVATAPIVQAPVIKDELTVEVERVLEDGLGDFYATLNSAEKEKFKIKGEHAATEITIMVRSMKINFKRVLWLIRDWLLTFPSINKFFLEQEAKIKVDTIKAMVDVRKEEAAKNV